MSTAVIAWAPAPGLVRIRRPCAVASPAAGRVAASSAIGAP